MKSKIFILLKNILTNTYKFKTISKKKLIGIIIFVIYLIGSVFMTLSMLLGKIFETLNNIGMGPYYITVLFALTSMFTFFFTIFSAKSCLFDSKDNDLLLSLPIKRTDILASRLIMVALINLIMGILFYIPGLYVYFTNIATPVTFSFIIALILLIVTSPIIPTVLSCLIGYLVAFITSKARRKNIVELVCYSAFIGIYLLFMLKGNALLTFFTSDIALLTKLLKYVFFPIYLVNQGIVTNNLLYMIYFLLINFGIVYLFVKLLGHKYFKIISSLRTEKTSSNFKMKHLVSSSAKKALMKKEIKKYFSSAIYVFNTAFGVVMFIIAAGASLFYSPEQIAQVINFGGATNTFTIVLYLLLFIISFTVTTNSAISIERKSFWILKMLPVTPKDIFEAKTFVNKIILVPFVFIGLIIFTLKSYITLPEAALLMLIAIIYNAFIANIGLIINLFFPKLDALNDTVIVKQSFASFFGIIVPLVFMIIIIVLVSFIEVERNTLLISLIALLGILYFVSNKILYSIGIKKFAELN